METMGNPEAGGRVQVGIQTSSKLNLALGTSAKPALKLGTTVNVQHG